MVNLWLIYVWIIPMMDPWCWYINANIDWGYIDGIHGTPYIAAPWILWDMNLICTMYLIWYRDPTKITKVCVHLLRRFFPLLHIAKANKFIETLGPSKNWIAELTMLTNKPGYPPPTIRLLRIQVPRWERYHRGILRWWWWWWWWWWRLTGWGKLQKKLNHGMVNQSCFQSDSSCCYPLVI